MIMVSRTIYKYKEIRKWGYAMEYSKVRLDSKHLLAFFARDDKQWQYIGRSVYYHQCMDVFIPFSEYRKFIRDIVKLNIDVLVSPLSVYKRAIHSKELLFYVYNLDIALINFMILHKCSNTNSYVTRLFTEIDSYEFIPTIPWDLSDSSKVVSSLYRIVSIGELQEALNFANNTFMLNPRNGCLTWEKDENISLFFLGIAYYVIGKNKKCFTVSKEVNVCL